MKSGTFRLRRAGFAPAAQVRNGSKPAQRQARSPSSAAVPPRSGVAQSAGLAKSVPTKQANQASDLPKHFSHLFFLPSIFLFIRGGGNPPPVRLSPPKN